jgi:hypothetical protein
MLNAIGKEEVIELLAADLTAEVREQSLGVTADARDKLDISLLSARLFAMRDKQLGTSLDADEAALLGKLRRRRLVARQIGQALR